MTIEEAIKLLQENNPPVMDSWCEELTEAVALGIEALKAVIREREIYAFERIDTLPGETKE